MMNNKRHAIVITESKKKIDKIKKKYKNLEMDDQSAQTILNLEITNNVLKTATVLVGIITTIDLIVPDPVFGLDEIALSSITTLLGTATKIVGSKIENIINLEDSQLKEEELVELSTDIYKVAKNISKKDKKTKQKQIDL